MENEKKPRYSMDNKDSRFTSSEKSSMMKESSHSNSVSKQPAGISREIIIGVVLLLVVIAGIFIGPMIKKGFKKDPETAAEPVAKQEEDKPDKTESSVQNDTEKNLESSPDLSETENTAEELSGAMDDIKTMHSLLRGIERTEAGSHEHWYEDLNEQFGYGNNPGSSSVDDLWIETDQYTLYGVSVNKNAKDAVRYLADQKWLLEESNDYLYSMRKDDILLSLKKDSSEKIISISAIRDASESTAGKEGNNQSGNEKDDTKQETSQTAAAEDDDYFFPDSLDTLLSESQLYGMSARELTLARNEVYARYGYTFKRQDLQEYFNTKSWYKANPKVNADTIGNYVSSIGMQNMVMIREYQKRNGLTY